MNRSKWNRAHAAAHLQPLLLSPFELLLGCLVVSDTVYYRWAYTHTIVRSETWADSKRSFGVT